MSDELKTKESLLMLKECIDIIQHRWLSVSSMEEMLDMMVPKDQEGKQLVKPIIKDNGTKTGIYIPRFNTIEFSVLKCRQWVVDNLQDLSKYYNVTDQKTFGYYLTLFIMLHEIEHSYQYLVGQGKVEAPCKMVQSGYKTLTELLIKPDYILPRPIKQTRRWISLIQYYRNQNMYALERNANVEAFSTILQLAIDSGNEEMIRVFTDMTNAYMGIGYQDDCKGVFYHTFKDTLMMDKYRKIKVLDTLSIDEKIRYGLEIPNYKRTELLTKIKGRTV